MTFVILIILEIMLASLQASFIFGGDSAEYSLISATLSVPHAPGYPLYSLISNLLVNIIPVGTVTWKAAFLSSIPTVLTSFLIYKILFLLLKNKFVAIFSALFYVFLFIIWLYALIPEVFALNNLLIASITYLCLLLNQEKKSDKLSYLLFFFIGLSIANHHTFILFLPGWFLLLKQSVRKTLLQNSIRNILFLILGASFYLYAPIASNLNPPHDWENAKTLEGFIRLITRSSYGTFSAYPGAETNLPQQLLTLISLFIFLLHDFRILGIATIILGIYTLSKINRRFFSFIVVSLLIQCFFIFISKFFIISPFMAGIYERFLTFIYLTLIFPFGIGVWKILEIFGKVKNFVHHKRLKLIVNYSIYFFFIIFLLIVIQQNYLRIKKVRNLTSFETYAKDILNTAPKNSIVNILTDTPFFASMYIYHVDKYRNDIKLIFVDLLGRDYMRKKVSRQYPEVFLPKTDNVKKIMEDFLKINSKKYSIFFEKPLSMGYWLPYGLLWKYYPSQEEAMKDTENIYKVNNDFWTRKDKIPLLDKYDKDLLHLLSLKDHYTQMYYAYSLFLAMNNRYEEAEAILNELKYKYKSNIEGVNIAFLEVNLNRKDCLKAKQYADSIDETKLNRKSVNAKIVLRYYNMCDPTNIEIEKYIKLYETFKKNEDVSLKKL